MQLFRHLPILGVFRDRRGEILDVTNRLLEVEHRRRRDVVGKSLLSIWPHGEPWLVLDRKALKARAPLVQLEHASGRWVRSTRLVERKGVVWVGEDVSAEVRLAATLSILGALGSFAMPSEPRRDHWRIVEQMLEGQNTLPDIAAATGILPIDGIVTALQLTR